MQRNRTRTYTTLLLLVLVAGATLLLAGCNPGGVGIFYTLEHETRQTSTSAIGNDRTIGSMMMFTGTPNAYYVGAGSIYTSTTGSSLNWQKVTAPSVAYPNPICNQIAVLGTTLYAIFYNANGSESALYSATISGADTSPGWSEVAGFVGNSQTMLQSLFVVNSTLFVTTQFTNSNSVTSYSLYQESNPSTPLLSNLASPVTAGAFETDDSTYWFVAGNQLYTGTALTALAVASGVPSLSQTNGEVFDDIYWTNTPLNTLLVSTNLGGVYARQAGSWSGAIQSWPSNVAPTGLQGFTQLVVGSTRAIMIGSTAGYYEWDLSSTATSIGSNNTLGRPGNTTTTTATVNYVSSNLAAALILGFFNDSTTGRVFALTGGYGLWVNGTDSSGNRAWTQE